MHADMHLAHAPSVNASTSCQQQQQADISSCDLSGSDVERVALRRTHTTRYTTRHTTLVLPHVYNPTRRRMRPSRRHALHWVLAWMASQGPHLLCSARDVSWPLLGAWQVAGQRGRRFNVRQVPRNKRDQQLAAARTKKPVLGIFLHHVYVCVQGSGDRCKVLEVPHSVHTLIFALACCSMWDGAGDHCAFAGSSLPVKPLQAFP